MATILVIDDDPRILSLFRELFETMGHRVLAAGNGNEGLDLFHQRRIDLVVANVFTPEHDGLEVIMTLRREAPTVPIIGFSDRAVRYELLNVAKQSGAVQKYGGHRVPGNTFRVAELLQAVQNALENRVSAERGNTEDR